MKNKFILFISFCCVLFLIHLNYLYVDIMEARNFVSVREMVDDGNWIYTTLNGEARYQKPPLPTWLSAGMAEIFGTDSVWALRFPAALSCVLLILYFFKLVKKETENEKLAVTIGLIFSTAFLVLFVGKRATWDIFCYSFAFVGVYYWYKTFKSDQKQWINFSFAGIFLGLSILSKGPTGIYVIGAPFFLAYWIAYGFPKIKWAGWIYMGVLMAIIGFSWYAYVYLNDQETFLRIMEEESSARTNREVKPFTRYFSFPIQMGVWAIFAVVSLALPYLKKKTEFPKTYTFFFWWTIICFVLLSLVPSKKERYLFPLMIPLAATTGIYVYYLFQQSHWKSWEKILTKFAFGLVSIIGIAVPFLLLLVLKAEMDVYVIAFSIASILIGIYLGWKTFKDFDLHKAFYGTVIFVAIAMIFGIPVLDKNFNSNPTYHSILTQKKLIQDSGLKLYGMDAYSPELWFKYQDIIPTIELEKPETYPVDSEFFLMVSNHEPLETNIQAFENLGYTTERMGEFDDNEEKEGTKNHVPRKKMVLYKVQKIQK
jgi:4-amino-4-deoxy-L-arabinose transferase-like glycosyltransferase